MPRHQSIQACQLSRQLAVRSTHLSIHRTAPPRKHFNLEIPPHLFLWIFVLLVQTSSYRLQFVFCKISTGFTKHLMRFWERSKTWNASWLSRFQYISQRWRLKYVVNKTTASVSGKTVEAATEIFRRHFESGADFVTKPSYLLGFQALFGREQDKMAYCRIASFCVSCLRTRRIPRSLSVNLLQSKTSFCSVTKPKTRLHNTAACQCCRFPPNRCWRCDTDMSVSLEFFCPSCHIIQPPNKAASHFEIMNRYEGTIRALQCSL